MAEVIYTSDKKTPESPDMRPPADRRESEVEILRVIVNRLDREIVRLNQLRGDVLDLKKYVQEQSNDIKDTFLKEFQKIYALFPGLYDLAFVGSDMENRLSKDIDKNLEKVKHFLTWFNVADYPELDHIEKKVIAILNALRELVKDNKSTVTKYSEALKKTSEEMNGDDNPPTEDSAAPEEAKGDKKPGLLERVRNWRLFGTRENIRSLLLELEALGDNSLYKS